MQYLYVSGIEWYAAGPETSTKLLVQGLHLSRYCFGRLVCHCFMEYVFESEVTKQLNWTVLLAVLYQGVIVGDSVSFLW